MDKLKPWIARDIALRGDAVDLYEEIARKDAEIARLRRIVEAARKYLDTGFTSARGELRAALAALEEQP